MAALSHRWNSLTTPGASAFPGAPRRAERLAALLCLCVAAVVGLLIPSRVSTTAPLFLITDLLRVALVAGASLFLRGAAPRPVADTAADRRGRITASINLCIIAACATLPWLDDSLYQWPPLAALYWLLLAAANLTPLLLVRAGRVQAAAALLVAQFILQVLSLAPAGNAMLDASEVPTFAVTIAVAGLLLRWWAGLILAPTIPLLHIGLAYLGIGGPPDWQSTITLAMLLSVLAAVVALHSRSLEAALDEADTNARDLAGALDDLRRVSDELRENRDALQVVVGSLRDGLALIDGDGAMMVANTTMAELCAADRSTLVGRRLADCLPEAAALVARAAAEGAPSGGRFQLQRPDGPRTIDVDCFPAGRAPNGRRVVLHLTDITERLQLESVAVQNARLAASGRMAAIVAHEVNSPLQAIQNFLYLASSDDPAERDGYLRLVADEIDRVGELIRRLLELNRPELGPPRAVEVNQLARRVLSLMSGTLGRHRIAVTLTLADGLPYLLAHPGQMTQVLLNLCMNAADAMEGGGELRLTTGLAPAPHIGLLGAADAPTIMIEVADSGPGIPTELLPRIFDPFVTTKTAGTGLGLAVSRQIVEQQGGQILAEPAPGGGALFRVLLPAAPASQLADRAGLSAEAPL